MSTEACAYDLHKKLSDGLIKDFSETHEFLLKAGKKIVSSTHLKFKPFTQGSKYSAGLFFYDILAFVLGCRKANNWHKIFSYFLNVMAVENKVELPKGQRHRLETSLWVSFSVFVLLLPCLSQVCKHTDSCLIEQQLHCETCHS